jgi:hypothetical protein
MVTNKISKNLKKELRHLLNEFPPDQMRTFLRTMFREYLETKKETFETALSHKSQDQQIHALLEFLDIAADETIGWQRTVAN